MTSAEIAGMTLLTVKIGVVATLANVVPGIGLAWLLARRRFPGRSLVQALVALPMVLPPVAVGLALLLMFSRAGPLLRWLGVDLVFTWEAAAVASAVMSFPLLVKAAEQAIAAVPRRLELVAGSLGRGPLAVFLSVTLPLARRGIAYGVVLSFTRALGEFGATNLVAGSIPGRTETLALGIYGLVQAGRDREALVLCAVSLALAFLAMVAAERHLAERRTA